VFPKAIQTGRNLSNIQGTALGTQGSTDPLVGADANRVGMAIALAFDAGNIPGVAYVFVGPQVSGTLVPFTCLTLEHPTCYLDVAHLGPAFLDALFLSSAGADNVSIAYTIVRTIRELE